MIRLRGYLLLGCFTGLLGCAVPGAWFPSTRPPVKFSPMILETEKFPKTCGTRAVGCYVPESLADFTPARIYIRPRLHPWERDCVLQHEMKHHAGWDHAEGFSDCNFDD